MSPGSRSRRPVACSASTWFGVTTATPRYSRKCRTLGSTSTGTRVPPREGQRRASAARRSRHPSRSPRSRGRSRRRAPGGPPRRALVSSPRRNVGRILPVGPHHLLVVGDDARLHRRGPLGLGSTRRGLDPAAARASRTRRRRRVLADAAPPGARGAPQRARRWRPRCPRRRGGSSGRSTRTTGTGASGEIRDTWPHTNSSSMTSPSTSTRRPCIERRIAAARRGGEGGHAASAAAARSRASANGTAVKSRQSIRTSESPRLYSKSPATKTARDGPRARPPPATPRRRGHPARADLAQRRRERDDGPPQQEGEAGQPPLGRDLEEVVVEVRAAWGGWPRATGTRG